MAAPPPPGQVPNLFNPPSSEATSNIVLAICLSISALCIIIRLLTRLFFERRFWFDDALAVLGGIGVFGHAVCIWKMNDYGGSEDIWNVSKSDVKIYNWWYGVLEIVARVDFTVTKVAILLLFLRCFFPQGARKTLAYWSIWLIIAINVSYCIGLSLTVELQCVGKNEPAGSTCLDEDLVLIVASIINVFSDLVVLVIPVMIVKSLQMTPDKKKKLWWVFGVGALAIFISVGRLGWQIRNIDNDNVTQYLVTVALLAVSEQAVGVIVSCMPVLPMFLRHLKPRNTEVSHSSYPAPRVRTLAPVSTFTRSFRQWRARRAESISDDVEMYSSSIETGTRTVNDDKHGGARHSSADLGKASTLTAYVDNRDKLNSASSLNFSQCINGRFVSYHEMQGSIGGESARLTPVHYRTM